ncbi:hypothetical protein AVEN_114658-1 [Araneus ventricosus]|uniref:Uncharacterized protein n=1 Tax=Araneus ventricosus TaxID=182803 RepID=A0A4Y2NPK0_ARAVE|nr:hypothetical protein AVEN_114658-1 [Araneus ventricosus]
MKGSAHLESAKKGLITISKCPDGDDLVLRLELRRISAKYEKVLRSLGQNPPPTQKLPELVGTVVNNLPKERVETNEGGSLLGRTPPPQGKPDTLLMTDLRDQERVEISNIERNSAPTLEGNGLQFCLTEHQELEEQEALKLASIAAVRKMLSEKIMDLSK